MLHSKKNLDLRLEHLFLVLNLCWCREQWPQPEEDGEVPPQLPGGGGCSGLLQPGARRPAPPSTVQGGDTGRGQGSAQEVRFETLAVLLSEYLMN